MNQCLTLFFVAFFLTSCWKDNDSLNDRDFLYIDEMIDSINASMSGVWTLKTPADIDPDNRFRIVGISSVYGKGQSGIVEYNDGNAVAYYKVENVETGNIIYIGEDINGKTVFINFEKVNRPSPTNSRE